MKRALTIAIASTAVLAGCAASGPQKDMDAVAAKEQIISGEVSPYRVNSEGKIALRQIINRADGEKPSQWVRQLLNESRRKARETLERIEAGGLSEADFRTMMDSPPFYVDVKLQEGEVGETTTLLSELIAKGHLGYIHPLVEAGADTTSVGGGDSTAIASAVEAGDLKAVEALIEAGFDVNRRNGDGWTPLHLAAAGESETNRQETHKIASALIDAGADINAELEGGSTPLYLAVGNARSVIQGKLIRAGADVNTRTDSGWTPVMQAAYQDDYLAVKRLVEAGAELDHGDDRQWTALHYAANSAGNASRDNGHKIVKILAQGGANLDPETDYGKTPLMLALANDLPKVRNALISAGANVNATYKDGESLAMRALTNDNLVIAGILIRGGANLEQVSMDNLDQLLSLIALSDAETTRTIMQLDSVTKLGSDKGWTLLHLAASGRWEAGSQRKSEATSTLLKSGIAIGARDNNSRTPLHVAVANGQSSVRDTLLEAGAQVTKYDDNGRTVLIQAAHSGNDEAVRALVDAGADLKAVTDSGVTALMRGVYNGDVRTVEALLNAGANPDVEDDQGWTPLHFLANAEDKGDRSNDAQVASAIIEAGADLNSRDNNGRTALFLAAANDREAILDRLIDAGAELDLSRDNGWTPLMRAVYDDQKAIVERLAAAGADVGAKDQKGWSPLHILSDSSRPENTDHDRAIASILVDAGANPDALNDELVTPLMLAALNGRRDVARALLEHDLNLSITNKYGSTAQQVARSNDNYDVLAEILEASHSAQQSRVTFPNR